MHAPALFTRREPRLSAAIQALIHGQCVQDPANPEAAISTVITDIPNGYPLPQQEIRLSNWLSFMYATAAIALVAGAVLMLKNLGALAFVICAALATLAMLAPPALAYAQVHSNPFIKRRL